MNIAKEAVLLDVPTNEVTELVSINEICRLCANKHEKLIAIYSGEGESNDLASKLNSYLPIKVDKNDDLPLQCCWQCASTVLAWHELVVTSIEADRRLRSSQLVSEKQLDISDDTNLADIEYKNEKEKESTNRWKDFNRQRNSDTDEDIIDEKQSVEVLKKDLTNNSCFTCGLSFKTKSQLKKHMFLVHQFKEAKNSALCAIFTCSDCKRSFRRKYDLQRHISKVHCHSNNEPSNRHKNYELLSKHKVLDDGVVYFKCDLCDVKLIKSSSFVDHYNIHLDKKQHCCHLCGKNFRTSSHVNRHINIVHYGNKKFTCQFCSQAFSSKTGRDEHVNIHTNNRPYMCALCGKSFKQSSSLYVHKLFHDQIYRFTCSICDKKFKRGGELKKHQVVHTGKRDYDCEVCKKSFRLANDLKRHQRIHDPYFCIVCGVDFKDNKLFKIHKKDHKLNK